MEAPCGHIDFYPNGGFNQPGCSLFDMPVSLDSMVDSMVDPESTSTAADTVGRHLVACSHNRGIGKLLKILIHGIVNWCSDVISKPSPNLHI